MLQPMAIAVIGGLSYSLVLTLFFLPSAYCLIFGRQLQVVERRKAVTNINIPVNVNDY